MRPFEKSWSISVDNYAFCVLKGYYGAWTYRINRLVLQFFGPYTPGYQFLEANHKDGNHLNNYIRNLEWVTHLENIKHAYVTGQMKDTIASQDIIKSIKADYNSGKYMMKDLAVKYGYSTPTLYKIISDDLYLSNYIDYSDSIKMPTWKQAIEIYLNPNNINDIAITYGLSVDTVWEIKNLKDPFNKLEKAFKIMSTEPIIHPWDKMYADE